MAPVGVFLAFAAALRMMTTGYPRFAPLLPVPEPVFRWRRFVPRMPRKLLGVRPKGLFSGPTTNVGHETTGTGDVHSQFCWQR